MKKGNFNGYIQAEYTPPHNWILTQKLSFVSDDIKESEQDFLLRNETDIDSTGAITVPIGFETNLASVPRFLWGLISPWDVARAAVLHDYLYSICVKRYNTITEYESAELRKVADEIFLIAMSSSDPEVPKWKIEACVWAVRLFGGKAAKPE